jgi:hypothetical protein
MFEVYHRNDGLQLVGLNTDIIASGSNLDLIGKRLYTDIRVSGYNVCHIPWTLY